MSDDDEFSSLKPSLRRAIDTTFLKLIKLSNAGNGELVRDKPRTRENDEDGEDGFMQDGLDRGSHHDQGDDAGIPLSLVPRGLQMLDLPPDDKEVLRVFRNAATGWENPRPQQRAGAEETVDRDAGLSVSKGDWRAVCAVLLGRVEEDEEPEAVTRTQQKLSSTRPDTCQGRQTRSQAKVRAKDPEPAPDPDQESGGGFLLDRDGAEEGGGFELEEEEAGSDSDEYFESDKDESSASEFGDQPKAVRRARGAEDEDGGVELETEDIRVTLTERQKHEARLAFALFFPDMDPNDPGLHAKKIGVREVGEAAKALKEQLSTEDVSGYFFWAEPQIMEMLSMFSSGPGGTVGLEEFGQMAVMAKLV